MRQNQTYVGNRLMFSRANDVELDFANIVRGATIWRHLKGVLLSLFVLWVVSCVVLVPLTIFGAARSTFGGSGTASGLASVLWVLLLIASVGLVVVAFTGLVQEPLSEWELMLDERSVSADSVYASIVIALRRREVPADVRPQRIAADPTGGIVRNYLVIASAPYVIYVSVLPYGNGLYLAWMMWREQRVLSLYTEWFRQVRNRWAGAGSLLHLLLRAEDARALREMVHNAMRDGVETAIAAQTVSLSDAFDGAVPRVNGDRSGTRRSPAPPRAT